MKKLPNIIHLELLKGIKNLSIGVVNPNLPFINGDAVVTPDVWNIVIDDPA